MKFHLNRTAKVLLVLFGALIAFFATGHHAGASETHSKTDVSAIIQDGEAYCRSNHSDFVTDDPIGCLKKFAPDALAAYQADNPIEKKAHDGDNIKTDSAESHDGSTTITEKQHKDTHVQVATMVETKATEKAPDSEPTKATETPTPTPVVEKHTVVKTEEPVKHEVEVAKPIDETKSHEPTEPSVTVPETHKVEETPTTTTPEQPKAHEETTTPVVHEKPKADETTTTQLRECYEPFDLLPTSTTEIVIPKGCYLQLTIKVHDVSKGSFDNQRLAWSTTVKLDEGHHTVNYPLVSCVEQLDDYDSHGNLIGASFVLGSDIPGTGPFPDTSDVRNATKRVPPCAPPPVHVPNPAACSASNATIDSNRVIHGSGKGINGLHWQLTIPSRNDVVVAQGDGNDAVFSFTGEYETVYRLTFVNTDGTAVSSGCDFSFTHPVTTTTTTTTKTELPRTGSAYLPYELLLVGIFAVLGPSSLMASWRIRRRRL